MQEEPHDLVAQRCSAFLRLALCRINGNNNVSKMHGHAGDGAFTRIVLREG